MAIQQSETARLQIIRPLCCLLLAAALLVGCSKTELPEPQPQPDAPARHTVLLYMPGQSLLRFYRSNIQHFEDAVTAGLTENGRVLVCYQPESYDKATLLEIRYDSQQQTSVTETLKIYEHFRAENPASVDELFRDVAQLAPAESYGLIIGSHGAGWIPDGVGLSLAPREIATQPAGAIVTRGGGTTDAEEFTRTFGDSGHVLETTELAKIVQGLPYRFDYLIFDACFMANIEMLYDLRDAFDYVIASPCEIIGYGFPYDRLAPCLFSGSTPDLASVCYEFWYFYMYDWDTVSNNAQSGCISLAVMDELEALAACVADILAGPLRDYDLAELQYFEGLSSHMFYDLAQYIRAICDDDIRYARFEEQLARAFPVSERLHTPSYYSVYNYRMNPVEHYSGVTTSAPALRYQELCQKTGWYQRTHAAN